MGDNIWESDDDPDAAWSKIRASQKFHTVPRTTQRGNNCTRIVCISDTHGQHDALKLPLGDVLIHGGDMTSTGHVQTFEELRSFLKQQRKRFSHVICIAGNHDITLHQDFYEEHWKRFHARLGQKESCSNVQALIRESCTYLEHATTTVANSVVFGSPWTPVFFDWAFNYPRNLQAEHLWTAIPDDTDILVSHGPPLGRCDDTDRGSRTGCASLLRHVQQRVRPRLHMFGHIHEGYGCSFDGKTLFVNASSLNVQYEVTNVPIVIDLPHDMSLPAMVVEPKAVPMQELQAWIVQHNETPAELRSILEEKDSGEGVATSQWATEEGLRQLYQAWKIRDKTVSQQLWTMLELWYAESLS